MKSIVVFAKLLFSMFRILGLGPQAGHTTH